MSKAIEEKEGEGTEEGGEKNRARDFRPINLCYTADHFHPESGRIPLYEKERRDTLQGKEGGEGARNLSS